MYYMHENVKILLHNLLEKNLKNILFDKSFSFQDRFCIKVSAYTTTADNIDSFVDSKFELASNI